jgi:hypothetical protein
MVDENPIPVPPDNEVVPDLLRPYKAYVAAVLTVVAFVAFSWLTDQTPRKAPVFTMQEFKEALAGGLLASGLVGGGTFLKKNPLKVRPRAGDHRR